MLYVTSMILYLFYNFEALLEQLEQDNKEIRQRPSNDTPNFTSGTPSLIPVTSLNTVNAFQTDPSSTEPHQPLLNFPQAE